MKTDLFQSCGHCWVFQICWHIECSTFTTSSFRISNSSTGIPSPPLALFVVMLPKPHLISHSSCLALGEWSHQHDYLGHEGLFCMSDLLVHLNPQRFFCVFLPSLLNIFCFCWVHNISVLYWAHLCMKCSLGNSNFLEEISSRSHSIVFYISLNWSLRKAFLSLLAIFWNSAFKWVYISFFFFFAFHFSSFHSSS